MNRLQWKIWWREQRLSKVEEWRSVNWFEWLYEISSLWRVKSIRSNKILIRNNKSQYIQVELWNKWVCKKETIHRLVAQAFIKNIENKEQVNHKNWIKVDNRLKNLEWVTRQENSDHAWKNWLSKKHNKYNFKLNNPVRWKFWIDNWNSKVVLQFDKKMNLINEFDSTQDVWRILWLHPQAISMCCSWKIKTSWGFIWKYKNID